jgi:hypothetical protein
MNKIVCRKTTSTGHTKKRRGRNISMIKKCTEEVDKMNKIVCRKTTSTGHTNFGLVFKERHEWEVGELVEALQGKLTQPLQVRLREGQVTGRGKRE